MNVQTATTDPTSLSEPLTTPAAGSRIPPQEWEGTELPDAVRDHPLLDEAAWVALRDSGRSPFDQSDLVTTYRDRAEFLVGAWLINDIVPRRIVAGGLMANLQPQMLRTADVLAAERFANAILEPRRSAKTTSLWCVLLGRCWMRPVYMAGYTMLTTAQKAAERFKLDVRDPIARKWRNPKDCPVKVLNANGALGIEFPNGSRLAILSPNGDAVRSGAYDVLVLDEAGEAEPDMWDDIVGAVVPSFDTRGPGAQLIYAGTGGKYRDGSHFWATLHDPAAGRLRYGVPDDVDEARLESWDAGAGELIEQLHPGLDGLTTIESIERNFSILKSVRFGMEYLGHFGRAAGNDALFAPAEWEGTQQDGAIPEGVPAASLAFAMHPGGMWCSIAVAWNLDAETPDLARAAWALEGHDDGEIGGLRAGFKLIHWSEGTHGLVELLWKYARQLNLPIIYNDAAQERMVIEKLLARARPQPRVSIAKWAQKTVADANFIDGVRHKTLHHWRQEPLDQAAAIAVPRRVGKAMLIGAPDDDADITPLEAASLAVGALTGPTLTESFAPIVVA